MFNNCHTAPLLRHLYFLQRSEDQAVGIAIIPRLYDPRCWAVALHWRRGDVMSSKHVSRQLPVSYFLQVARAATNTMSQQGDRCIRIHIFSDGDTTKPKSKPSSNKDSLLAAFSPLVDGLRTFQPQVHINIDPTHTLHHLITADLLVTSKSGFSYLAGQLSDNIVLAATGFATAVDCDDRWVSVQAVEHNSSFATFDIERFSVVWKWHCSRPGKSAETF
eukprot:GGOE01000545.1.p2 GENE.GGOE01000545.1~~GGOE01000545.1.p2  ORF type:complete len:219 (-),score=29.35 GGOE01000545.1:19-675(-)